MEYVIRSSVLSETTAPSGAWHVIEFGFHAKVVMARAGTAYTLPVWEVHMVR